MRNTRSAHLHAHLPSSRSTCHSPNLTGIGTDDPSRYSADAIRAVMAKSGATKEESRAGGGVELLEGGGTSETDEAVELELELRRESLNSSRTWRHQEEIQKHAYACTTRGIQGTYQHAPDTAHVPSDQSLCALLLANLKLYPPLMQRLHLPPRAQYRSSRPRRCRYPYPARMLCLFTTIVA